MEVITGDYLFDSLLKLVLLVEGAGVHHIEVSALISIEHDSILTVIFANDKQVFHRLLVRVLLR